MKERSKQTANSLEMLIAGHNENVQALLNARIENKEVYDDLVTQALTEATKQELIDLFRKGIANCLKEE
jgi:hypothetical protein